MQPQDSKIKKNLTPILGAFAVVILGVVSAWLITSRTSTGTGTKSTNSGTILTSKSSGTLDPKVKYDNTKGELKEGGNSNNGTHHLVREGGDSQNVYLTSSTVDLSDYVGKKVEVWGQTLSCPKNC